MSSPGGRKSSFCRELKKKERRKKNKEMQERRENEEKEKKNKRKEKKRKKGEWCHVSTGDWGFFSNFSKLCFYLNSSQISEIAQNEVFKILN